MLNSLPSWVIAAAIVLIMLGFTTAVSRLVRRRWANEVQDGHNEVTGLMFQTVGVMYALLLAFVMVSTWEATEAADAVVTQEAATVQALYRDAVSLPEPTGSRVGALVIAYAETVIAKEWPELAHGRGSEAADDALDAIFPALRSFEPRTAREEVIFAAALGELNTATEERFARLHAAQSALPGLFWLALILGAMLTQVTAALLYMRDRRVHDALSLSLAAVSGLLIFLVVALDIPFAGDLAVSPDAFHVALEEMRRFK